MPTRRIRAMTLFLCALTLAPISPACAKSVVPHDALAWWRFDPTGFGSAATPRAQRETVLAGMRAAVSSRIIDDRRAASALEGVLVAAEVGATEHTLCLLDFAAERPPDGAGMDVQRLQIILELRTGADHSAYVRTIRAILVDAPRAGGDDAAAGAPRQRVLELPGGRRGVAFTRAGWPDWREVSWSSHDGVFVVAMGRGALHKWFEAQENGAGEGPEARWAPHRASVDEARPAGEVFLEAYADLRTLRNAYPEAFHSGRISRVLATLGLLPAAEVMAHARRVRDDPGAQPLVVLDTTTTPQRGAAPVRTPLSESSWPGGALPIARPPGTYVIVSRVDWAELFALAMHVLLASTQDSDADARRASMEAWEGAHGASRDLLMGSLGPWLVVCDSPTPLLPIPGAATFIAPLSEDADAAAARRALENMLGPFRDRVDLDPASVWSLRVDPAGFLRLPAWGIVEGARARVFVGGWGVPVVTETRERLRRE